MPPLEVCGRSFLIAADDLTFIAPVDLVASGFWAVAASARVVRDGAWGLHVPLWILDVDVAISVLSMATAVLLFALAARGRIMEAKARNRTCGPVLVFRGVVLGLPQVLTVVTITVTVLINLVLCLLGREHESTTGDHPDQWDGGWGGVGALVFFGGVSASLYNFISRFGKPEYYALFAYVVLRSIVTGFACTAMIVTSVPQEGYRALADLKAVKKAKEMALRCSGFGKGNSVLKAITMAVTESLGDMSLKKVVPSDIAFGLLLVATAQGQGFMGSEPRELAKNGVGSQESLLSANTGLSKATARACTIGHTCSVKPLQAGNAKDKQAIQNILRYEPFVRGIYGFSVSLLTDSTRPGTSIITPLRFLRAIRRNLPGCCTPRGPTSGDILGANEHALRKAVGESSSAELVYATWENRGVGTASPFAVFVDRQRREVVLTVRGTLDVKDALVDLGAAPAFFSPFGQARADSAREPPFDDEKDFFVHAGMKAVAADLIEQVHERGLLDECLKSDGDVAEYDIVCVGHSLGAGVACIVALMLWENWPSARKRIRYVGFEPPGGLVSKGIARRASELGWVSVACGHDMVPRLSVKAMQSLREDVLAELDACDRSKFQLTLLLIGGIFRHSRVLFCLKGPLANAFECMGGGHLVKYQTRNFSVKRVHNKDRMLENTWSNQLYPAGDIVYCKPLEEEWQACGLYPRATAWSAEWVPAENLTTVILSYRSMEMHVPPIIKDAFHLVAKRLEVSLDEA